MPISRASESSASGRRGELALFPDRLDPAASVDVMLVTLLPGEQATFHITTVQPLDSEALTTYPVLRCVNESRG